MRLGIIGTAYNSGIGHIAWGFANKFDAKTLIVHNKPFSIFRERYPNSRITKDINKDDIDWLLQDIDALLTIETPYNWSVYPEAKKRGIKTFLMPMYEWLDQKRPELRDVDCFICPSISTYEKMWGNKVQVPSEVPVDLNKFDFRPRKKAKVFLHISGHGGIQNRNSTLELINAMPLVKSDIRMIINSQYELQKINDPRVIYQEKNFENYWDMYEDGDIWFMPAKYGVAFLGIQEAAASGMIPAITNMPPFNKYLPEEILVKPTDITTVPLFYNQMQIRSEFTKEQIASEIDRIASLDLTPYQDIVRKLAHDNSWEIMKPKYEEIFKGEY